MKSKSKPQRTQGVTLVNTTTTGDDVLTEEERGFNLVAALHPRSNRWNMRAGFLEECVAINVIESVGEVYSQYPFVVGRNGVIQQDVVDRMDDSFTAVGHADTNL